jgi:conjugal transfer/entry exclusion protein
MYFKNDEDREITVTLTPETARKLAEYSGEYGKTPSEVLEIMAEKVDTLIGGRVLNHGMEKNLIQYLCSRDTLLYTAEELAEVLYTIQDCDDELDELQFSMEHLDDIKEHFTEYMDGETFDWEAEMSDFATWFNELYEGSDILDIKEINAQIKKAEPELTATVPQNIEGRESVLDKLSAYKREVDEKRTEESQNNEYQNERNYKERGI